MIHNRKKALLMLIVYIVALAITLDSYNGILKNIKCSLYESNEDTCEATKITLFHPIIKDTLYGYYQFWTDKHLDTDGRHIYHRRLTISANNYYNNNSVSNYIFEDTDFPEDFAFTDSSIVLFTKKKLIHKNKILSKVKIETIDYELSLLELKNKKFEDLNILTFLKLPN